MVSVNTVIHPLDPTTMEHADSRKGKLFYYNGNKLCIATYNCVIFSVECLVRLYNGVIWKIVCMWWYMFFCVLFSVTSKLMQSIYDPRMNCCASIEIEMEYIYIFACSHSRNYTFCWSFRRKRYSFLQSVESIKRIYIL